MDGQAGRALTTAAARALRSLATEAHVDSDRTLCGWRVRSALPLPELGPWEGADRDPDIEIFLGPLARELPDAVHRSAFLQITGDGTCQFEVDAVARYLITAGSRVVVDQRPGRDGASVRLFLLGTVFALLCHQRSVLPMHASCVAIGGTATAFTGDAGAGKSVLAAVLVAEGHSLLADDVCAVRWQANGIADVLPGAPRLLLWRYALAELGIPFEPGLRARRELEKYVIAVAGPSRAVPLGAVYELEIGPPPSEPVLISGTAEPRSAHAILHCARVAQQLHGVRASDGSATRLAAAAPRYSLTVGNTVRDTAEAAQFVLRHRATVS